MLFSSYFYMKEIRDEKNVPRRNLLFSTFFICICEDVLIHKNIYIFIKFHKIGNAKILKIFYFHHKGFGSNFGRNFIQLCTVLNLNIYTPEKMRENKVQSRFVEFSKPLKTCLRNCPCQPISDFIESELFSHHKNRIQQKFDSKLP